jgi:integrase
MKEPKREKNLAFVPAQGNMPAHFVTEITIRGRRIRRLAGYTKAQAQKFLNDLRGEAYEGRLEEFLDPKPEGSDSFERYTSGIIESETWKQKRSYVRDQYTFARLKAFFKEKQVDAIAEITPAAVQDYINTRRTVDGVSPATVNREIAFLRSILYLAVEDGLIESNPLRARKGSSRKWRLDEDNSREEKVLRHLSDVAVRKLIDAADDYLKPILKIAAMTGMRRGEILKMEWRHVNLEIGSIFIPRENSKSKRERWVPIDPIIFNALAGQSRASEYVFINPATGQPWKSLEEAFGRACEAAGIPCGRTRGIVFHDLRHYAASSLVKVTDIVTASRILGHSDVKMTMRYVHPSEADKRLAMERVGERLFPPRQEDANAETAASGTDRVN